MWHYNCYDQILVPGLAKVEARFRVNSIEDCLVILDRIDFEAVEMYDLKDLVPRIVHALEERVVDLAEGRKNG